MESRGPGATGGLHSKGPGRDQESILPARRRGNSPLKPSAWAATCTPSTLEAPAVVPAHRSICDVGLVQGSQRKKTLHGLMGL